MKRSSFIFVLAVFAMVTEACVNENMESLAGDTREITVSIEGTELTRTVLDDSRNSLNWTAGDKFGFFTDVATDLNKSVVYETGAASYTVKVAETATEVYAYYPWDASNSRSGRSASNVNLAISPNQIQHQAGVLNGENYPMVSKAAIGETVTPMVFTPLGCALALNVYGAENADEKVKSVTFTSSIPVAGESMTDLTSETVTYVPKSTTVRVTLDADAYISAVGEAPEDGKMYDKQIYLVVAKQNYTEGTITVRTTYGRYIYKLTEAIDCTESDFVTIPLNLKRVPVNTGFEYEDLLGNYLMEFESNGDPTMWIWSFTENVPSESYYVNWYRGEHDGYAPGGYQSSFADLEVGFTGNGNTPMQFLLPQERGNTLYPAKSDGTKMTSCPDGVGYDLTYSEAEGSIVFTFIQNAAATANGLNISGFGSTWDLMMPMDGETNLKMMKYSEPFEDMSHECEATPNEWWSITLPLFELINVASSDDTWLDGYVDSDGDLMMEVGLNETGADRTGYLDVTVVDETSGIPEERTVRVEIRQKGDLETPSLTYENIIGDYNFTYTNKGGSSETKTFRIEAKEQGVSYKASIMGAGALTYTMVLNYVENSGNPYLSLICPQTSEVTYSTNWTFDIHPTKKYTRTNIDITKDYAELDVEDAGCGFDLKLTDDYTFSLEFIPNAASLALYPDGFSGIWYKPFENRTFNSRNIWDWFRPVAGQEYLRITKK